jgi:hypothetical protein
MRRKCVPFVLTVVALSGAVLAVHAKDGKPNPGIVPPGAKFRGLSYGEWAAEWWKAMFAIPVVDDDHPLFSGGAVEGPKGVLFLTGVFSDPDPAVIEISIRPGTALFFPVINAECSEFEPEPFHGDDEAEMRAQANHHMDNTSGRFAKIDGRPVQRLDDYRCESPLFVWGPLPEGNLFQYFGMTAPAGTTSPAVDAGYYLLLHPLSVGKHTVEFGARFDELGGIINTKYIVNVVP